MSCYKPIGIDKIFRIFKLKIPKQSVKAIGEIKNPYDLSIKKVK